MLLSSGIPGTLYQPESGLTTPTYKPRDLGHQAHFHNHQHVAAVVLYQMTLLLSNRPDWLASPETICMMMLRDEGIQV